MWSYFINIFLEFPQAALQASFFRRATAETVLFIMKTLELYSTSLPGGGFVYAVPKRGHVYPHFLLRNEIGLITIFYLSTCSTL